MDWIGAFLGFAVLVAVVAIVIRPLVVGPSSRWSGPRSAFARQMDERARLLEQRVGLYSAIQELEFDHETGKVSDEEFARQRAELVEDGVAVLMQLDALAAAPAEADAEPLEAAIAAMRRGEAAELASPNDAALEAGIRGLRASPATNGDSHTCPECGTPAAPDDRFCGTCGAALETACPACGTPYHVGDVFCAHCGAALVAEG